MNTPVIRLLVAVIAAACCGTAVARGACLTGVVTDGSGTPILDVDLDFYNAATGVKLVTPGDNTDATGFYNVCVLPGIYHVTFDPPPGTHLLGKQVFSVDLSVATEMNIVLDPGVVVSGIIRDSAGTPLGGCDLDADSLGAGRVYTPNDVSEPITGQYWLVVPPDTYRLRYDPPPGTRYRGVELDTVPVVRDTVIDITMAGGWLLSGRVADAAGIGLERVSVDLRVDSSGAKVFVANNKTDSLGYYAVAVPGGVFELRYTPQSGSRYVAALVDSFAILGDTPWSQTLYEGLVVRFDAHDSTGAGVANMDIDFKDIATGAKLFTPGDNTALDGSAVVTVPAGLYSVQLDPPPGSIYDRVVLDSVDIQSDTLLAILVPEVRRVAFTGRVEDLSGVGIAGVELKFVSEVSGNSVFVPGNITAADGSFAATPPIGLYEVQFAPPAGSRYVAARRTGVTVQADTVLSPIVLAAGFQVTGWVIDMQGDPVVDADFDFVNVADAVEVFTPADNTDATGRAQVIVAAGTYRVTVTPPVGSPYQTQVLDAVAISVDTVLTFVIASVGGGASADLALNQNYPNPFNAQTTIRYAVLTPDRVSLTIYNLLGQRVHVLTDRYHAVGVYEARWDGRSSTGSAVASGMYFYQLKSSRHAESRKLLLIR